MGSIPKNKMDKLKIRTTSHETTFQQFQQIYTELPIPKEVKIEYGKNIWRKKKDKKRINYELLPADLIKIPEKITNITGSKYAVTQKKHTSYRCVSFYRGLNAINNIEDKKIGETRNIGRFQMFHEKSDQKWPYQSHKIVRKREDSEIVEYDRNTTVLPIFIEENTWQNL